MVGSFFYALTVTDLDCRGICTIFAQNKEEIMDQIKQVCVYCASSAELAPKYFEAAARMGDLLAAENIRLIYGGGSTGLMGKVADHVLAGGGEVVGVIPEFMDAIELGHKGVQLQVVPDMHTRKRRFFEGTEALITLPGGCGTLEELLEAITWKRLGLLTCPIIIVNVDGYFDPMVEMLNRAVDEKFMNPKHREMWTVVSSADEVLDAIRNAPTWSRENFKIAVMDRNLGDSL